MQETATTPSVLPEQSLPNSPQNSNFLKVVITLLVMLLTLAVGIIFYFLQKQTTSKPSAYVPQINTPSVVPQISVIPSPLETQSSDGFFITKINKPLEEIELIDLPNNSQIRNVIEYKEYIFAAGDGSVIQYDKKTGAVIRYSNLRKANCDSEIAIIKDYLYAACRIDNVADAFGTTSISKTPYFSEHQGIFKINLANYEVEKIFTKEDGLLNQYNFELYADGDMLWVATFDGLGRIDTTSNTVEFYKKELGYPNINQKYGVIHMVIDTNYVWAFISANAYSQGGVALYEKKSQTWKAFGPSDLMEFPSRFDLDFANYGYLARLVSGGIQIGFRDGKIGENERLVEKKYEYSTSSWTMVDDHVATGSEYENTYDALSKVYPPQQHFERDKQGLTQIQLSSEQNTNIKIDGRANYVLSPVVGGKRYILTDSTVDLLDLNPPFRRTLVYLGETLSFGSGFREAMYDETPFELLIDSKSEFAIVVDAMCDGMTCDESHNVWFVNLANNKISKIYSGDKLPEEKIRKEKLSMDSQDNILNVSSETGEKFFEVNTKTNEFKLLITPTPLP